MKKRVLFLDLLVQAHTYTRTYTYIVSKALTLTLVSLLARRTRKDFVGEASSRQLSSFIIIIIILLLFSSSFSFDSTLLSRTPPSRSSETKIHV